MNQKALEQQKVLFTTANLTHNDFNYLAAKTKGTPGVPRFDRVQSAAGHYQTREEKAGKRRGRQKNGLHPGKRPADPQEAARALVRLYSCL